MIALALSAAAALFFLLFVWGFHLRATGAQVGSEELVGLVKKPKSKGFGPLGGVAEPFAGPFTSILLRTMSPAARGKLNRRIERAGRPYGLTVEGYARNKAGTFVLLGSVGVVMLLSDQLFIAVALFAMGWFQTDIVLWNLSQERQQEIQKSLPDFLDVLAVTVTAGLSFRQALSRVAESMPGALAQEMMTTLRQMDVGTPFRQAFEDLRARNNSEQLSSFVTAILQAEELGAPLANALADISIDMRREAAQLARRRAQRAEPKITMITTFMMVPGMLMLILAALYFGMNAGGSGVLGP
ncbi:type II secretion system F family protein [Actinomadura kijaniata]|uniref:type II secretion system F family protein n=1 Tax=Actinomadura kijaniata TaxID=46161 RepID=UPI000831D82B|nr:type II secretion system F family protein [Actinomadura kijaniata]